MSRLYRDLGEKAAGQKVCLATTAYESPDACYVRSIQATREALSAAGIGSCYLLLEGNCHVDDARNSIVAEFLAGDCTDLLFLDADVMWEPADLVRLCKYDRDFLGAVYPYRDPARRDGMPCRTLALEPDEDGLLEMDGLPTGFMRLRRSVLEEMSARAQQFRTSDLNKPMPLLFERATVDDGRMSGDLYFCRKWREQGGRIWADPEIRLGHAAKTVVTDSLGAALRRQKRTTLRWLAERIGEGRESPDDFHEAFEVVRNAFAASPLVLAATTLLAREGRGPVIEAGCGISTILMAAALPRGNRVYCLEHDPVYSLLMQRWARSAGVSNIGLLEKPLKDGWYDVEGEELPMTFALGFCDGPPRAYGTRMRFFDTFGQRCRTIVVDDADTAEYQRQLLDWAKEHGRSIELQEGRLAVIR